MKAEQLQRGYEGLVFAARHWDLLEWLENNWVTEDVEDVVQAAQSEGFSAETRLRLKNLLVGPSRTMIEKIIYDLQYEHGKKLISVVIDELRALIEARGMRCSALKRVTSKSNWLEREFGVWPRRSAHERKELTFGSSIEYLPGVAGVQDVYLTAWFWLRSAPPGLAQARMDPKMGGLATAPLLGSGIEKKWPRTVVFGAARLLDHADEEFRFDVGGAVAKCMEPFANVDADWFRRLYQAAAAGH